jgi:hypothetical protein
MPTANIGPNFVNEVQAAGLGGLPFSWTPEDITYGPTLTAAERTTIEAVLSTHNPAAPEPRTAAAAALERGIALTSTSTPALNGTYPLGVDPLLRQPVTGLMTAEQVLIAVHGKFSNGQTTRAWHDGGGTPHEFTTAQFSEFAAGAAQFVDAVAIALSAAGADGKGWVEPSHDVLIS